MRRHLVAVVMVAMFLVLLLLLVPLVMLVMRDAKRQAIESATDQAVSIAALGGSLATKSLPRQPVDGFAASVFLPDGRVIGVPAPRPPARCTPSREEVSDGVEVLVPAGGADCRTMVRVLATTDALRGNTTGVLLLLLTLSASVVILGAALADRLARSLTTSMKDLATVADRMAAGELDVRVTPGGPGEVRRVGAQLNRLAVRVDHLVDEQGRHAADLAHRVRTPLTSLRLNIDALPDSDDARRLVRDHDSVTHALNEAIRSVRRNASQGPRAPADLCTVLRERVAFWSVLAEDTGRAINCDLGPGRLPVRSGESALAAMLDALLENVFAHTPDGVSVLLHARQCGRDVRLVVEDAGPGFPDLNVVQRGRSDRASTGLGLDIVRRTAEQSGGRIRLGSSPSGGARIEIVLGGCGE